jgi:hypothetical protein
MPRRGAEHHNATLTDDQVKAMRVIYTGWKERGLRKGYRHAAKLFSCGVSTARDILTYRTRYDV